MPLSLPERSEPSSSSLALQQASVGMKRKRSKAESKRLAPYLAHVEDLSAAVNARLRRKDSRFFVPDAVALPVDWSDEEEAPADQDERRNGEEASSGSGDETPRRHRQAAQARALESSAV